MPRKPIELADRLSAVAGGPDECWLWRWSINVSGRGSFRGRSAPRQVYELVHQCCVLPDFGVQHSCDNPTCVNPAHLSPGTQKENMRQCSDRGRRSPNSRQLPGERHSLAKLTAADVAKIRARRSEGEIYSAIARDFPVGATQIKRICTGERWKAA